MFSTFNTFNLNFEVPSLFEELEKSSVFEPVAKGRKTANVYMEEKDGLIPIVRTTTCYKNPLQKMKPRHVEIVHKINEQYPNQVYRSNNAMIEVYTQPYTKMGWHSDQALDLYPYSYIGVFVCCNNPNSTNPPLLLVKPKDGNDGSVQEIPMNHHSAIVFSTEFNSTHLHRITLQCSPREEWMFITFRYSLRLIYFKNEIPYFDRDDTPLVLANETQKKEFYREKKMENTNSRWEYIPISYTVSPSDLIHPK